MLADLNWCQWEFSCYCKFNLIWQLKNLSKSTQVCIIMTERLVNAIYMWEEHNIVGVRPWVWFCTSLSHAMCIVLLTLSTTQYSMNDKVDVILQLLKFIPGNYVWIFWKYCKLKMFLFKNLGRSKQSYTEISYSRSSNNIVLLL